MIWYLIGVVVSIFIYRNFQLTFVIPKREMVRRGVAEIKTQCRACRDGVYGSYKLCEFHHNLLSEENPLTRPPMFFYGGTWTILGSSILWPITMTIVLTLHLADYVATGCTVMVLNMERRLLENRAAAMERKTAADERMNQAQRERERIARQRETFSVLDSLNN